MVDQYSPISEFYPRSFTVDMNGKRWPWEATVLLPFFNSERLVKAVKEHVNEEFLSEEEKLRNKLGITVAFRHDESQQKTMMAPPAEIGNDDYFEARRDGPAWSSWVK